MSKGGASTQPLFLESGRWRRFAVHFSPPQGIARRGALVLAPAFFEEMNKSRRMVANCSRALAERGWSVLVVDLLGCGDSPGDFEDASWHVWVDDLVRAHSWLRERSEAPVGLWGMRAGALLAYAAAPLIGELPQTLLWQPVQSGKAHLHQFLRLKVAAVAIGGGEAKINTRALLDSLERGDTVEVSGYTLSPQVALSMQQASLEGPTASRKVIWLEVSASPSPILAPASQSSIDAWRASGVPVTARAVQGPSFWATQEIEECPALIEATLEELGAR